MNRMKIPETKIEVDYDNEQTMGLEESGSSADEPNVNNSIEAINTVLDAARSATSRRGTTPPPQQPPANAEEAPRRSVVGRIYDFITETIFDTVTNIGGNIFAFIVITFGSVSLSRISAGISAGLQTADPVNGYINTIVAYLNTILPTIIAIVAPQAVPIVISTALVAEIIPAAVFAFELYNGAIPESLFRGSKDRVEKILREQLDIAPRAGGMPKDEGASDIGRLSNMKAWSFEWVTYRAKMYLAQGTAIIAAGALLPPMLMSMRFANLVSIKALVLTMGSPVTVATASVFSQYTLSGEFFTCAATSAAFIINKKALSTAYGWVFEIGKQHSAEIVNSGSSAVSSVFSAGGSFVLEFTKEKSGYNWATAKVGSGIAWAAEKKNNSYKALGEILVMSARPITFAKEAIYTLRDAWVGSASNDEAPATPKRANSNQKVKTS